MQIHGIEILSFGYIDITFLIKILKYCDAFLEMTMVTRGLWPYLLEYALTYVSFMICVCCSEMVDNNTFGVSIANV